MAMSKMPTAFAAMTVLVCILCSFPESEAYCDGCHCNIFGCDCLNHVSMMDPSDCGEICSECRSDDKRGCECHRRSEAGAFDSNWGRKRKRQSFQRPQTLLQPETHDLEAQKQLAYGRFQLADKDGTGHLNVTECVHFARQTSSDSAHLDEGQLHLKCAKLDKNANGKIDPHEFDRNLQE